MKFVTKAIHVGDEPDFREGSSGDVVVPIHLSTTFARKDVDEPTGGYEYTRCGNPTRHALESKLAALENANFGLAFSSGLAAESTLLLSLLKTGDHVIACEDLYGGTRRLFHDVFQNFGVEFTWVSATNTENVAKAIKDNSRLFWLETPTNPLMNLCDVKAIAKIGKKKDIVTVVDNTFMTPYFQNPLGLGADVVVHSMTKYLGGHSDVLGGAVMVSNEKLFKKIKFGQNAVGAVLSPFDCFLVLRGIKTLPLRMERHEHNARRIAEFLGSHPKVTKVHYPGLPSHPQHELAKKQMSGFGGMLSFEMKGTVEDAKSFLRRVKTFTLADSLGGVESLIGHPASMSHSAVPEEERKRVGISDTLIRVSVGTENIEDLIADLEKALS